MALNIDLTQYGPGRPMSNETMKLLKKMVSRIGQEPGIPSGKLARELGIKTVLCSKLARRLEKRGFVSIDKTPSNSLTYTLVA